MSQLIGCVYTAGLVWSRHKHREKSCVYDYCLTCREHFRMLLMACAAADGVIICPTCADRTTVLDADRMTYMRGILAERG